MSVGNRCFLSSTCVWRPRLWLPLLSRTSRDICRKTFRLFALTDFLLNLLLALYLILHTRLPLRFQIRCLRRMYRLITRPRSRRRLLSLRFIQKRRFSCPFLVCDLRKFLDLSLSDEISLLFLDAWGFVADVSEPLVPLCCFIVSQSLSGLLWMGIHTGYLDISVVSFGVVFDDTAVSVGVERIAEFPERVTG